MCGDTQCPSCGPAQGNYKCPICGAWADDCCEHFEVYCSVCGATIDDDPTVGACEHHTTEVRLNSKFQTEFEAIQAAELAADDAYAAALIEEAALYRDWKP